ncbi:hypothetical protein ACN08Y_10470 [Rothia sp. P5764]|uniref:hypothetical protein n=1 Tax=Rothia sp. P5764 TaxID=3402654 RepID=UPI003AD0C415
MNALKQQARKNNEPTYQEILKALKPQDGYTLAAMESERHPDMEEGVEYYE